MIFAEWNLSLDPSWPWSIPTLGLPAMLAIALVLAGLTIWTYLGVGKATWLRILIVLGLRLLALALAFCMMIHPSFGVTHPEGVETSKVFVVFDDSESMNEPDGPDKSTRWEQMKRLWSSRNVQRRLEQLGEEQKIELVKFLAAEELRPGEPDGAAAGKRTEIGRWLHQLWQRRQGEKQLRGVIIFSDGSDNGKNFSPLEKAGLFRGTCPVNTFGAGNPGNSRFGKDIALTEVRVEPTPVIVKNPMTVHCVAQAPGFDKIETPISVWMEEVKTKKSQKMTENLHALNKQAKDQKLVLKFNAPEEPGEYKVTVKIPVQPGEASDKNNEINTFVQVVKQKINVLWVDRPRVYEPQRAIAAIKAEPRFSVHYVEPPPGAKLDPIKWYRLDKQHYDVIVIGDVSAQRFSLGNKDVFAEIQKLVQEKKTGLLMLGGEETFVHGGWDKQPAILELLPVTLADKKDFIKDLKVQALPTKEGLERPFLQLLQDPKKNDELWKKEFEPLEGISPLGEVVATGTVLAKGAGGELLMAEARRGEGRVVVFAGDATAKAWILPDTAGSHARFWRQLVLYLSQQLDSSNQLLVHLDKRRVAAGGADSVGFTVELRGKTGVDLTRTAKIDVRLLDASNKEYLVPPIVAGTVPYRGVIPGPKEPGEYRLLVAASAKDVDGSAIQATATVRFLVESEEVEMLRPVADHELLSKIAAAGEGRFYPAEERALLQYLDGLKEQVNGESRMKTTHWPDWKRLPASEHVRDQLAGVWSSFSLPSLILFVLLLGGEWFLRRWWGLV